MTNLLFSDFMTGLYDEPAEDPFMLYVCRDDEGKCLYVGISRSDVFGRWFYGSRAHVRQNIHGEWFGGSPIGKAVCEAMPKSVRTWHIELWGLEELRQKFHPKDGILDVEAKMIHELHPTLNRMCNA